MGIGALYILLDAVRVRKRGRVLGGQSTTAIRDPCERQHCRLLASCAANRFEPPELIVDHAQQGENVKGSSNVV